ncbi:hypothetical protein [Flavobacterium sp. LB2R40]|uniref:hypothetical protein n=1 Tax=unclassified Flavobacterium TaxID=196869 RepID=UPI003AAFFAB4
MNFVCNEKLFAKAVLVFLVAAERLLSPTLSKGKGENRKNSLICSCGNGRRTNGFAKTCNEKREIALGIRTFAIKLQRFRYEHNYRKQSVIRPIAKTLKTIHKISEL